VGQTGKCQKELGRKESRDNKKINIQLSKTNEHTEGIRGDIKLLGGMRK
jgi:hypothetical protein